MYLDDGEITNRQKSNAFRLSPRTKNGVVKRADLSQTGSTCEIKLDET